MHSEQKRQRFRTGQELRGKVHLSERRLVCGEKRSTGFPARLKKATQLQFSRRYWFPTPLASFRKKFSQPWTVHFYMCWGSLMQQDHNWPGVIDTTPAHHQKATTPPWCFSHKLDVWGQDWRRFALDGPISLPFCQAPVPVPVKTAVIMKWYRNETVVTAHASFSLV